MHKPRVTTNFFIPSPDSQVALSNIASLGTWIAFEFFVALGTIRLRRLNLKKASQKR
jgi:hypothetical protein